MKPLYGARQTRAGLWRGAVFDPFDHDIPVARTLHVYGEQVDATMAAFREFPPSSFDKD